MIGAVLNLILMGIWGAVFTETADNAYLVAMAISGVAAIVCAILAVSR